MRLLLLTIALSILTACPRTASEPVQAVVPAETVTTVETSTTPATPEVTPAVPAVQMAPVESVTPQ